MYWFSKDDEFARTCLGLISPDADNATNLKQIRDALTIDVKDDTEIDFDNLSSIPDIWATHRIFDMMLYLPPNVRAEDPVLEQYRAAVVRQWKAILTVMLIGQSHYNLTIQVTEFSAGIIANNAAGVDPANRFMGAVVAARPDSFIWEDEDNVPFSHDKIQIYCIEVDGEQLPIAVSSPTTYFVPAPDAWKNLYGRVPWIIKTTDDWGRVRYRVDDDFLEKLSYAQAAALLNALQNGLRRPTAATIDKNRASMYNNLVSDFVKDRKLIGSLDYFRGEALFIPEFSYFSGEISTAQPDDTDPLLGGVDACCYYVDGESYMKGARPCYHYFEFFMPITELCKDLLAQGILDYSIYVSTRENQIEDAMVTLTRRSDGAAVRKSYGGANPIYRIDRMSDISSVTLWPRQKIEGWDTYFAFRYDEEMEQSAYRDKVYARYSIEPDDTTKSCYLASQTNRGREHRYYAMRAFPDYWTIEKKTGEQTENVGYIKTRVKAIPLPIAGNTYYAAVDFGTTSTMLYGSVNDDVPKPISASVLYAGAVCNPNRGIGNDQSASCFVPPKSESWNIALLHSLLALAPQTPEVGARAPLYGIWAYFRTAAAEKRALPRIGGLKKRTNLKWTLLNQFDTKSYLTEVLRFLTLAARVSSCGSMCVYASYPAAMSESRKDSYTDCVREAAERIAAGTGIGIVTVNQITESFAVATEVSNDELGTNFCAIDIGGGTSDIYIYYKSDLQRPWQGIGSSLRVGAREIFHSEFWRTPNLLTTILNQKIDEVSILLLVDQFETQNPETDKKLLIRELTPENLNEEQMQSAIEELLEFSILEDDEFSPVADMLKSIVVSSNNTMILNFRQRIAYYVGAVCYYAGMLARERRGMEPLLISNLTIQFAGNGSRIVHWISDRDEAVTVFVKEMFRAGMMAAELPRRVQFSKRPKHEVARGALLSRNSSLHVEEQNVIIAGERFQQGRTIHSEFSPMDTVMPNERIEPEYNELKAFLAVFRRLIGKVVPCGPECRRYEFPAQDELGFKTEILNIINIQRSRNEGIIPFFLAGVEVIDAESRKSGGSGK